MALNEYVAAVQTLLHDQAAQFFSVADLENFVNEARSQIAIEGECVRALASLTTAVGVESYMLSSLALPDPAIRAAVSVWQIMTTSPPSLLEGRSWPWFNLFWRTLGKPQNGPPAAWAIFKPGASGVILPTDAVGSIVIGPTPDAAYALSLDIAGIPFDLLSDADPEIIPFPWTHAIQFYAAYLAYKESQREQQAQQNFALYEQYMARARGGVTAQVMPGNYPGDWRSRAAVPAMSSSLPAEPQPPPGSGGQR